LTKDFTLFKLLQDLFASQRSAVLATSEDGQPYLSLMAFAASDDLKFLVLASPRSSRKYRNLIADSRVALLVDNRTNQPHDVEQAIAVTALGVAEECALPEIDYFLDFYRSKHPNLKVLRSYSPKEDFMVKFGECSHKSLMMFFREGKNMKKLLLPLLVVSSLMLAVGGCATYSPHGLLYVGSKGGIATTDNISYSKVGRATSTSVLGLVATGDSSIKTAAAIRCNVPTNAIKCGDNLGPYPLRLIFWA
jgi:hypothetical protein